MADLSDVPTSILRLPKDEHGRPVPWYAKWYGNKPSSLAMGEGKFNRAVAGRRCFLCGERLGVRVLCWVVTPLGVATAERVSAIASGLRCPRVARRVYGHHAGRGDGQLYRQDVRGCQPERRRQSKASDQPRRAGQRRLVEGRPRCNAGGSRGGARSGTRVVAIHCDSQRPCRTRPGRRLRTRAAAATARASGQRNGSGVMLLVVTASTLREMEGMP